MIPKETIDNLHPLITKKIAYNWKCYFNNENFWNVVPNNEKSRSYLDKKTVLLRKT